MSNFKIGDVVRLHSGGPAMTVSDGAGRAVECTWFNDATQLVSSIFPAEALKLVKVEVPLNNDRA